ENINSFSTFECSKGGRTSRTSHSCRYYLKYTVEKCIFCVSMECKAKLLLTKYFCELSVARYGRGNADRTIICRSYHSHYTSGKELLRYNLLYYLNFHTRNNPNHFNQRL